MSSVQTEMIVNAPIKRVFALNLSVDLHVDSTSSTGERVVAGVTTGLLDVGDSVTFEATHFGFRQCLTSRVSKVERPRYFQDVMVRGAFKSFVHDHYFVERVGQTIIQDVFTYSSPLGFLGSMANVLFLDAYMQRFLLQRLRVIKNVAESEDWRKYLVDDC